jgi:hypothetical protein
MTIPFALFLFAKAYDDVPFFAADGNERHRFLHWIR